MRTVLHPPVCLALAVASLAGSAARAQVVVNEVLGSTTGTDSEYVELYNAGTGPVDIGGWAVYLYDSDAGGSFGGLDGGSPYAVPAGITLNAGQHFLFANATAQGAFGVAGDALLPENAIENSSYTIILKDAANGVVNALLVKDTGAGDVANNAGALITPELTVGPDGSNLPAGFTRTSDGAPTFSFLEFSPVPAPSGTPMNLASSGGGSAQCSDPVTLISAIQGPGLASPDVGASRAIKGVVVGDFQGPAGMNGFFVQEEAADQDPDPGTSEGIFVFDPAGTLDVAPGDVVRVAGTVSELNGQTQISSVNSVLDCGDAPLLPAPVPITLPETVNGELERYEGMRVQVSTAAGRMTVAQNFFLGRYGQLTLASPDDAGAEGRLFQPTNQHRPLSAEALALAADNARRLLVLDDGFEVAALGDNPNPVPYLGSPPPAVLRAGDAVENLVGILNQGRVNASTPPAVDYRLQPTESPVVLPGNPRTVAPEDQQPVGGRIRVASFNVLNYFTTIDQQGAVCFGPDPNNCRGADSTSELDRQRDKLVAALSAIDADVIGLIELENNFGAGAAIADLVAALNAVPGGDLYTYVDPDPDRGVPPDVDHIGTDAIAQGFLYKPAAVVPVGDLAILTSAFDPAFIDTLNRPTVAQTFEEVGTGERFTVAVNHLKSKGSDCNAVGDPDLGDGQGNCNQTRAAAAAVLAKWLATDPTASQDPDFLIIGDLNAYAMEDPVVVLHEAGYRDQVRRFEGKGAYSYIFDGLSGSLDHALVNVSLSGQVTGVTSWHINTDEPAVIDYDESFNPPSYYSADPYRSSDHDPVVIGLALGDPNPVNGTPRRDALLGGPGYDRVTGGPGGDTMTGGGGVDVYPYTSLRDGGDTITDFEVGVDAIDLRPLLAALGIGGDPVSSGVVSVRAGRDGDATLYLDPDGSAGPGRAVALVRLSGIDPVTVSPHALLVLP